MEVRNMLRRLFIGGCLLASSAASAEVCEVRVMRAPDAIRERVEFWVAAERQCSRRLEVRIVPTDAGFYLFARDERGRVHERVVPDGDSAGVLVASWIADDSITLPSEFDVAPADDVAVSDFEEDLPEVAPPVAPDDHAGDFDQERPRERARRERAQREYEQELAVAERATAGEPPPPRWFGIGAVLGDVQTQGLRAELDVWHTGKWTLAVAGQVSTTASGFYGEQGVWQDSLIVAMGIRNWRFGAWTARLNLGVGLTASEGRIQGDASYMAEGIGRVLEGGGSLTRAFGRWAVTGGVVLQHFEHEFDQTMATGNHPFWVPETAHRNDVVMSVTGGLRYAL